MSDFFSRLFIDTTTYPELLCVWKIYTNDRLVVSRQTHRVSFFHPPKIIFFTSPGENFHAYCSIIDVYNSLYRYMVAILILLANPERGDCSRSMLQSTGNGIEENARFFIIQSAYNQLVLCKEMIQMSVIEVPKKLGRDSRSLKAYVYGHRNPFYYQEKCLSECLCRKVQSTLD